MFNQSCIKSCSDCATTCFSCAETCINEQMSCWKNCLECAEVCQLCVKILSLKGSHAQVLCEVYRFNATYFMIAHNF